MRLRESFAIYMDSFADSGVNTGGELLPVVVGVFLAVWWSVVGVPEDKERKRPS